ncbi:hypothetical protein OPV22_032962 [Ensete ventricosum]|uniref:BOS complex subunit TMEM147 n=1 Tax=Ensete ventricosum TaxID=4639 RepID=A0AAV8PNR5_ENSVE|nr:hypothetical protein OPV22_032962 [Ensete ventricosum]
MTVFHFFNYAILTFGPHAVYYSATPLSEYDTIGTSVEAAIVYLGTALGKELLKALIGFTDVAGLYFALTQLTHRNISQNHEFQAVGLGKIPECQLVFHFCHGPSSYLSLIICSLSAVFSVLDNGVLNLSLAALGSIMWLRKNKPRTLIPIIYACAGVLATMPSITRSEYDTIGTSVEAAIVYLGTALGKVCSM